MEKHSIPAVHLYPKKGATTGSPHTNGTGQLLMLGESDAGWDFKLTNLGEGISSHIMLEGSPLGEVRKAGGVSAKYCLSDDMGVNLRLSQTFLSQY